MFRFTHEGGVSAMFQSSIIAIHTQRGYEEIDSNGLTHIFGDGVLIETPGDNLFIRCPKEDIESGVITIRGPLTGVPVRQRSEEGIGSGRKVSPEMLLDMIVMTISDAIVMNQTWLVEISVEQLLSKAKIKLVKGR